MSAQSRIVYLPDTGSYWPWPRRLNPHFKEVGGPSVAWLESFGAFNPQAQEAFNKCKFSASFGIMPILIWRGAYSLYTVDLLGSLGYPDANKGRHPVVQAHENVQGTDRILGVDQLRAGCDLMNFFFLFDEYSDVEDEKTVQEFANIIMDALRNPHKPRPAGESLLGEVSRQYVPSRSSSTSWS